MHDFASKLLYLTIIAGVILAFAAPGGTAFHHSAHAPVRVSAAR